jgi:tetrapyrrole methylase family protein/MazG family protein
MEFNEKRPLYLLKEISAILRGENGCAWDKEQTSSTLKPYLIEEAYEVYEAINKNDRDNLKEELGDLLYQVYAHAQIASEDGAFDIDDVAEGMVKKLVGRHPHVFGEQKAHDSEWVINNWEKIKKKEKAGRESILDGVPVHLPALLKAYRIQQKVSRVGFDWEKIASVEKKLDEEIGEFKSAMASGDRDMMLDEVGDILFTIVNLSRFLKLNPEEALFRTIDKFTARFKIIESEAARLDKEVENMSPQEMDEIWEKAKRGG